MKKSLEARLRQVYHSGVIWEYSDEKLDQNDQASRLRYVFEKSSTNLPLRIHNDRWGGPSNKYAITYSGAPGFDKWIWGMNSEQKINWIKENNSPYVVLWLRVSKVADYYFYYFNHWKPRGDTGYLDIDCPEEPITRWLGYLEHMCNLLNEHGFLIASTDFGQERVPFLLAWGGSEIPNDDPRWDDDEFEPAPVQATIHECLFGDP